MIAGLEATTSGRILFDGALTACPWELLVTASLQEQAVLDLCFDHAAYLLEADVAIHPDHEQAKIMLQTLQLSEAPAA